VGWLTENYKKIVAGFMVVVASVLAFVYRHHFSNGPEPPKFSRVLFVNNNVWTEDDT
jgi:hypothetical protein